jgi:hypothetical protein
MASQRSYATWGYANQELSFDPLVEKYLIFIESVLLWVEITFIYLA